MSDKNVKEKMLAAIYLVPVMIVGFLGNLWVIITLVRILYTSRNSTTNVFKHMNLYILSLAITDLCVICIIPAVGTYFIQGYWSFGFVGCKIFFAVENVNKLLSVILLTLMSIERFLIVCRPFKEDCCGYNKKHFGTAIFVVVILSVLIIVLCSPIIRYANIAESANYVDGKLAIQPLCISTLPDSIMSVVIACTFILGFVLPGVIICFCYTAIVFQLRKTDGQRLTIKKHTQRVVRSVIEIVLFHFCCWAPTWISILMPLLSYWDVIQFKFIESGYFQAFRLISSFLPYLNSAFNWLLYSRAIRHSPFVVQHSINLDKTPRSKFSFIRSRPSSFARDKRAV